MKRLASCLLRRRARDSYPMHMVLVEMAGNVMGPIALLRSRWRVWKLGRSRRFVAAGAAAGTGVNDQESPVEPDPANSEAVGAVRA
jgi:hypothetical protein